MTDFDKKYNSYLDSFNSSIDSVFNKLKEKCPSSILDACIYSVKNGGKRIRPILCLSTAEMLGVDYKTVMPLAICIELIHSYSLVHDDLPCMDNDDMRRGQLSTHKKFGEAYGVLTGDALLNLAFEISLSFENIDKNYIKALKLIADYSGYSGMIYGQMLDIDAENLIKYNEQNLYAIYLNKTAKLLTAPLLVASIMANNKHYKELELIGNQLGYLFQIQDDILDEIGDKNIVGKTTQKDKDKNKLTAIKVFGLNKAKNMVDFYYNSIKETLKNIENSSFLRSLVDKIVARTF